MRVSDVQLEREARTFKRDVDMLKENKSALEHLERRLSGYLRSVGQSAQIHHTVTEVRTSSRSNGRGTPERKLEIVSRKPSRSNSRGSRRSCSSGHLEKHNHHHHRVQSHILQSDRTDLNPRSPKVIRAEKRVVERSRSPLAHHHYHNHHHGLADKYRSEANIYREYETLPRNTEYFRRETEKDSAAFCEGRVRNLQRKIDECLEQNIAFLRGSSPYRSVSRNSVTRRSSSPELSPSKKQPQSILKRRTTTHNVVHGDVPHRCRYSSYCR